jgi:hypothetical protein
MDRMVSVIEVRGGGGVEGGGVEGGRGGRGRE